MDVWNIPSVVSGHIILAFLFGSVPLPQIITVRCWGEKTHTDKQYEHSLKCTRQRMPCLHSGTFSSDIQQQ